MVGTGAKEKGRVSNPPLRSSIRSASISSASTRPGLLVVDGPADAASGGDGVAVDGDGLG